MHCSSKFQNNAVKILTNIAANGTSAQVQKVVDAGAIPKLINLLEVGSGQIQRSAVWGLRNIAGDNLASRGEILKFNTAKILTDAINKYPDVRI